MREGLMCVVEGVGSIFGVVGGYGNFGVGWEGLR